MTLAQANPWQHRDRLALAGVAFSAHTQTRIQHWAEQRPDALALLHKHHGVWSAWRWRDVAQTVAAWQQALAQQGLGSQARLAVSGALEPQLILLSLAAHAAGATVLSLDRHAQGEALREWLQAAAPTHAFVQERKTLSAWLHSGYTAAQPVPLYAAHTVSPQHAEAAAAWRVLPLAELPGPQQAAPANPTPRLRSHQALWVDEGTEWQGGLEHTITTWLAEGSALAAPELSASATRDRHEIQPQRVLASATRQQLVQQELQARLAPPGSLARRLSDLASSGTAGALLAWLPRRIARLHGLPDGPVTKPAASTQTQEAAR